jgi:endoglucanase
MEVFMKQNFLDMISCLSPSGFEQNLQQYISKTYKSDDNTFEVLEKGELSAIYNKDSNFGIMLAAHADEISLIIDGYNSDGTLHVAKNGGIRTKLYVGCKVKVLTLKNEVLYGVMGLRGNVSAKSDIDIDDLYIDMGYNSKEEAMKFIPIGSYAVHDTDTRELANNRISGRAIDDRIGDYIIHEAAKLAFQNGSKNKIIVTTTTGEENTGRGAYQAVEHYKPQIFVAVDVTYSTDYMGADEPGHVSLGKGGVICNGSIPNRKLNELLRDCAKELNLPIQDEVFAGRTGTDADTAYKAIEGPAILLYSIPLRYMHSPSEVVDFNDVENMIKVLARFLVKINKEFNLLPYEI